jgi:hypothetical protein
MIPPESGTRGGLGRTVAAHAITRRLGTEELTDRHSKIRRERGKIRTRRKPRPLLPVAPGRHRHPQFPSYGLEGKLAIAPPGVQSLGQRAPGVIL